MPPRKKRNAAQSKKLADDTESQSIVEEIEFPKLPCKQKKVEQNQDSETVLNLKATLEKANELLEEVKAKYRETEIRSNRENDIRDQIFKEYQANTEKRVQGYEATVAQLKAQLNHEREKSKKISKEETANCRDIELETKLKEEVRVLQKEKERSELEIKKLRDQG
ncbi:5550_t:CDS:2 [Acaulospora colombiana]|uniref:5550_t:CDS:1 n=1 Tax=Acaulospora colombiana TaxID=27376 RepID=A0ACA9MIK1_9GLOM|nr:5550_t:CDS:2 [Acaulospora colombiana]